MKWISVGLCDDNDVFRDSLEQFINDTPGFRVDISASTPAQLMPFCEKAQPEIILMDIDIPGVNGIEATRKLKKLYPEIFILMLTVYEDEEKIFDAILAGASGYLLKKSSPDRIIEAFHEVKEGGASMSPLIVRKVLNHFSEKQPAIKEYDLSNQEKKVLECLVRGCSYKLIASECHISMGTVRFHINNIYKKLHINSKSEAVAKAINENLVKK
jgi:DNA-binding NarL/FixJ family response regulator